MQLICRPPRLASATVRCPETRQTTRRRAAARTVRQQTITLPSIVSAAPAHSSVCCFAVTDAALEIAESDLPQWQACQELLKQIDIQEDKIETILKKAFGWGSQAYWRNQKVRVTPDPSQVSSVLQYLRELGIDGADLGKLVLKFPEVLGCSVEKQLQRNVVRLEEEWRLKGAVLANTLKRQPEALGYYYDCGGDCVGECNRCWVRF